MAHLQLNHITKRFGRIEAIKHLSLDIRNGEFFCLLGPPGAGKTTLLRLIAGLERPDEGDIYIDSVRVNDVFPGDRDVAIVFQNLALYPHKTVYENIAFPLRERKIAPAEIEQRVRAAAKLLHIEQLLARKPARLSGGERQRVAIGRALVRRPRAYLMDEPLANLDARLRLEMRVELKHLQKDLGQTFLYVTNDQIEALSMADRMAVLNKGVLQQCDEPDVIYRLPANRFVATIVGSPPMNFLPCTLAVANGTLTVRHEHFVYRPADESGLRAALAGRSAADGRVWLGVRPEDIGVYEAAPTNEAMLAEVVVLEPLGQETIVDLRLGREIIKARVPPTRRLHEHQTVWITFDPAKLHLFDAVTDTRLYTSTREQPLVGGRKTL